MYKLYFSYRFLISEISNAIYTELLFTLISYIKLTEHIKLL